MKNFTSTFITFLFLVLITSCTDKFTNEKRLYFQSTEISPGIFIDGEYKVSKNVINSQVIQGDSTIEINDISIMDTSLPNEFYLNVDGTVYSKKKKLGTVKYAIPLNTAINEANLMAKVTHTCSSYDGVGGWIFGCSCCSFTRDSNKKITGCQCCEFGWCDHTVEEETSSNNRKSSNIEDDKKNELSSLLIINLFK